MARRTGVGQKLAVTQLECERLRAECQLRLNDISADLRAVKVSLVGQDANGGLVAKVNVLNEKVLFVLDAQKTSNGKRLEDKAEAAKFRDEDKEERRNEKSADKTEREEQADRKARYVIALVGLVGSLVGIFFGYLLSKL